ncbi:DNA (cytosine-5)-methyltransferase 1B-like protein [Tanacetum coccineum]
MLTLEGFPFITANTKEYHSGSGVDPEVEALKAEIVRLQKGRGKLARVLQENKDWKATRQKKRQIHAPSSSKLYIQINEDEIANNYPLLTYYKTFTEETDEYVIFNDFDTMDGEQLPRSMLYNWSLYNYDSRLISLELLPMKPCADIDVTLFGSGVMTADDGSGLCSDDEPGSTSGSSAVPNEDGIPIYQSAIKE